MNTLSICIPTHNRSNCLHNCLESIYRSKINSNIKFDVCISDNASTDNTKELVESYMSKINIIYHRNHENLGLGLNILKSVELSNSEFAWIIGNDDMLFENSLTSVENLFKKYPEVDYFFVNSSHLSSEYVFKYPQPFDLHNLPENMVPFSKKKNNKLCNYFDLIHPSFSFDFLLGMFLNIFRREKWVENLNEINNELIKDKRVMSNIYNTFPHNIIFAKAFKNSKAFFNSSPLIISLYGERNWWKDLYPFVEAVRIPELVDVYRKNGLPFYNYLICKNFAVRKLLHNLIRIILLPNYSGLKYLNFYKHILGNLLYPSIYFMPIFYFFRKIYKIIKGVLKK